MIRKRRKRKQNHSATVSTMAISKRYQTLWLSHLEYSGEEVNTHRRVNLNQGLYLSLSVSTLGKTIQSLSVRYLVMLGSELSRSKMRLGLLFSRMRDQNLLLVLSMYSWLLSQQLKVIMTGKSMRRRDG